MLLRLFSNNIRCFKSHPLPKCSSILSSTHNDTLIHPLLLQQNIKFSLSAPLTSKKAGARGTLKTQTKTHTSNRTTATDVDRIEDNEHNERNQEMLLQSMTDPATYNRDDTFVKEASDAGYIENVEAPIKKKKIYDDERYAYMIKKHLNNGRLQDAINVLEIQMIEKDGIKPSTYIYNLLISGCARTGSSKKAFHLFTNMQQSGVKLTEATYTTMFNACSTCPWPHAGLNQARRLREIMLGNGHQPNVSNYNVMIKAFGRCGDLTTAFQLVEEMESKNFPIGVGTHNFLLQACITDANFGFRYALMVWHKMYRQRGLVPDLYSFNLMLRCVRDCSIGDIETMQQVISDILIESRFDDDKQSKTDNHLIEPRQDFVQTQTAESNETVDAPNLVTRFPHLGSLVVLSEVNKPEDRLSLLGGVKGILNEMKELRVQPDIRTFTVLLDVIPSTNTAEDEITEIIRKHNIDCDIGFLNTLIRKKSMRLDYDGATSIFHFIKTAGLKPNIVTFTAWAMGCRNVEEAGEVLTEIENRGMR